MSKSTFTNALAALEKFAKGELSFPETLKAVQLDAEEMDVLQLQLNVKSLEPMSPHDEASHMDELHNAYGERIFNHEH